MKPPLYGYIRLLPPHANTSNAIVDQAERRMQQFADSHGYELIAVFIERATSRAAFDRLMHGLLVEDVHHIIVPAHETLSAHHSHLFDDLIEELHAADALIFDLEAIDTCDRRMRPC
ncbi:recombinase family protein [Micromonospora sp. LOL_014]|uniref:recombinase family protein n=1 Tax=Micromonospora sp. LOL_014 TaxID=3345415 RepID=UPI003A841B1E